MAMEQLLFFIAAGLLLNLTPGPDVFYILAHALRSGARAGVVAALGITAGCFVHIFAAAIGVSALLAASATAFTVLKWVGGAYLVWLGIQVWRSPPLGATLAATGGQARAGVLFRQGLLSAVTNPKGILFFAAFLPQFIDPARSLWLQFAIMAGTFAGIEVVTEFVIASTAHRIRPWLQRVGKRFNQACGGVFVAIGAALPLRA